MPLFKKLALCALGTFAGILLYKWFTYKTSSTVFPPPKEEESDHEEDVNLKFLKIVNDIRVLLDQ
jgi:hypothetical protein